MAIVLGPGRVRRKHIKHPEEKHLQSLPYPGVLQKFCHEKAAANVNRDAAASECKAIKKGTKEKEESLVEHGGLSSHRQAGLGAKCGMTDGRSAPL